MEETFQEAWSVAGRGKGVGAVQNCSHLHMYGLE